MFFSVKTQMLFWVLRTKLGVFNTWGLYKVEMEHFSQFSEICLEEKIY